jgi:hypothetical protein
LLFLVAQQFLGDFGIMIYTILAVSLQQKLLPEEELARANGFNQVVNGVGMTVAILIAGWVAETIGVSNTVMLGAGIAVLGIAPLLTPHLMGIGEDRWGGTRWRRRNEKGPGGDRFRGLSIVCVAKSKRARRAHIAVAVLVALARTAGAGRVARRRSPGGGGAGCCLLLRRCGLRRRGLRTRSMRCSKIALRWSFITSSNFSSCSCGCRSCAASTFLLRAFQRLVHPGVNDGLAFLHAQLRRCCPAVRAEDAHQVVFQRQEELRAARVALTAGRPRSWLSMRRLSWRSVPSTNRPPAASASASSSAMSASMAGAQLFGQLRDRRPSGLPSPSSAMRIRRCRRAGCRCRGRPCWWRW